MFGFVTPPKRTSRYLPASPLVMDDPADEENKMPEREVKEDEDKIQPSEAPSEEPELASMKKPAGKTTAKAKASAPPKAKATAKAKAKATAKAKAKALAKGKAKASPKKKSKTPEKEKETEKGSKRSDSKVLKRPASSTAKVKAETMADKLVKWREGLKKPKAENPGEEDQMLDAEEGEEQGEEEQPKEEDECVEPEGNATRNKYAASKFKESLKSNALPKHVVDVWQKGSRKVKTELVNSLFKRNHNTGKWEMDTDDPTFCRILKTQETNFGKESVESVPRSIMLHGTFRGDEDALAQAIACGDVVETECNGKAMLGFQKTSAGKVKQNTDETQATSGTAKLSKTAFSAMAGLQAKYSWKNLCLPGLEDQAHGRIKNNTTLALCDQPGRLKWEDCEGMFQEAAAAAAAAAAHRLDACKIFRSRSIFLCKYYVVAMFCYWRRHPSKQHVTDGGCNQELLQGPCNQAPIFKPEPTHNVFVRKSGPVKLRGKAAEIKCLGEPLLAYWSTCCDETNEQHQQILYLLQMSCKCEEILFENKSALAFSHLDFQGRKGFYVSCPLSALLCFFLVKAMEMQQPSKKLSLLMGTWVTYSGAISKRLI